MSKKENTITMTAEDGEEIVFEVVEQTTIAGQNYLLVTDAKEEDEDGTAYIMKEILAGNTDGMGTYEFVEEEHELLSISKVFEELLEDTDLETK